MDPAGVLLAGAALGLYPGGLFLGAVAALAARAGRLPHGSRAGWTAAQVAGCGLADVAVSLAPLPGSPAQNLPPAAGGGGNLAAVLLLMAAGIALAAPPLWRPARLVTGVACLMAVMALAVGTATLDLATLAGVPGTAISLARILVGACLLVAAPLLAPPTAADSARTVRVVIWASLSVLGLSLFVPALLPGRSPWLVGLVVAAAAGLHATSQRQAPGRLWRRSPLVAVSVAAMAAAAAVLAVLSGA